MSKIKIFCIFSIICMTLGSCSNRQNIERALETWVIRINLDDRPRMIGLALNKNLYAAYDAQLGALYKAWKGDILFTGPVYDNIHGTQPLSRGEAYIQDTLASNPWSIRRDGKVIPVEADYKGYLKADQRITLKYNLNLPSGEEICIEETPEYIINAEGRPGFERVFNTSGVPEGTDVLLAVSFEHLSNETDVALDGDWVERSFSERSFAWGTSVTGAGIVKLNRNDVTNLRSYFEPNATAHIDVNQAEEVIEDEETSNGIAEIEDTNDLSALASKGIEVIGQNDCAACHSIDKSIIGPSYTLIAQKYESSVETVQLLSQKIINGGSSVWGERAMSPHPNVSEADAKAMAAYILSFVPDGAVERKAGVAVDFYQMGTPLPSLPEVVAGQSPNASEVYPSVSFTSGNPDIGRDTDENFSGFVKDFRYGSKWLSECAGVQKHTS